MHESIKSFFVMQGRVINLWIKWKGTEEGCLKKSINVNECGQVEHEEVGRCIPLTGHGLTEAELRMYDRKSFPRHYHVQGGPRGVGIVGGGGIFHMNFPCTYSAISHGVSRQGQGWLEKPV